MSKKLTGNSSLSINNAPQQPDKIGLVDSPNYQTKTFRLSSETVEILEELVERFSNEANFKIAMGKIVEIAVFNICDKNLKDLLNK